MSEYQYFEFAAIDRRLTSEEQADLRRYSSRAHITASSFANEYHWGSFKGDTDDWMARYFDAHVHVANWGSRLFMLRLPRHCLPTDLFDYADAEAGAFSARIVGDDCILSWEFFDDSGEYWDDNEDGSQWLAALLPLRDELRRGDMRSLYLGWLARVHAEQIDDDDLEPPLPAGLQALTPAQETLAGFLYLDPDWTAAAANASPSAPLPADTTTLLDTWLAQVDHTLLANTARLVMQGNSPAAENTLRAAYLGWQRTQAGKEEGGRTAQARRQVDEIAAGVATARHQREEQEARRTADTQAQAAAERAQRLERMALSPESIWAGIHKTLEIGSGRAYDLALLAITDLAEALHNAGRQSEFQRGLSRLLSTHGKRKAWLDRLTRAGLY